MRVTDYMRIHAAALLGQLLLVGITNMLYSVSPELPIWLPDMRYLNLLYLFLLLGCNGIGFWIERERYGRLMMALRNDSSIEGLLPQDSSVISSMLRDITDRERHARLQEADAARQREDTLQDYMIKWAHEVKIPLSVSELIAGNLPDDAEGTRQRLRLSLERVKFLVGQVLSVGRATHYQEDLSYEPFSLQKAVKAAIRTNAGFFRSKNIALHVENVDHTVIGDQPWTVAMLEQLLNNASKYVHDGGDVFLQAEQATDATVLSIKDNGIGIPASDINRIFEQGFTGENGRRMGKSTGMGLYITKQMAERLGMGIEVDSTPAGGTTFRLIFPRQGPWFSPVQVANRNPRGQS